MSEHDKEKELEQETYVLYNMAITKIKMADSQYSEDTKEMCEVAVMGCLLDAYQIHDVYCRVLQYLRDNNIYERYLRPILELSLYPPEIKTQSNGSGNGEGNSNGHGEENEGINGESKEEKSNSDSNIKTKADTYDKISKRFIQDMFRSDNDL